MARRKRRSSGLRGLAGVAAGAAIFGALAVLAANALVLLDAHPAASADPPPVAIVFGAGLDANGEPSAMLADRLDGGIALYKSARVERLLFTGDNGTIQHNELRPMLEYALKRGVPRDVITLDYAGFNTYDSCYRAIHVFNVRRAILVTQGFHLARAMYLCRHLGMMDVEGSPRPDWGVYDLRLMVDEGFVRETLARAKAVWQANVTHPRPPV